MKQMVDSELRYRRLFEAAQDGILILDADSGMIDDANPFLTNILGYSREELLGKQLWEVGAFTDIQANMLAFKTLQENKYIRYEDLPIKTKNGELIQVEFVSNVYDVGGQKVIQCNIRDIAERKQAQDALVKSEALMRELSIRDQLTGLYNRRYMEETLEREIHRAGRKHLSLGIIMLDVDHFKHLNDHYGHAAGDSILRDISKMILKHVRKEDIPCRYGGDEMLIVMPDASTEVTIERANLICDFAKDYHHQFEGQIFDSITLSIGVSIYPDHGMTSLVLLKAADKALYQAKNAGRGQVFFYDPHCIVDPGLKSDSVQ